MSGQQGYDSSKPPWRSKKWTLVVFTVIVIGALYVAGTPMDAQVAVMALAVAGGAAGAQAWVDGRNAGTGG